MLFQIKGCEQVQLRPPDFHKQFALAVKRELQNRVFNQISERYGSVIALKINEITDIQQNPLLYTHHGVALFSVQFEAVIEKALQREPTLALVTQIDTSDAQTQSVRLAVGTQEFITFVPKDVYVYEGEDLVAKGNFVDPTNQYQLTRIRVGDFVRVEVLDQQTCKLPERIDPHAVSYQKQKEEGADNVEEGEALVEQESEGDDVNDSGDEDDYD